MKTRPIPLGEMAFETYPLVFPPNDEQPPWAADSIRDALRRAVEAGRLIPPVAERLRPCCPVASAPIRVRLFAAKLLCVLRGSNARSGLNLFAAFVVFRQPRS